MACQYSLDTFFLQGDVLACVPKAEAEYGKQCIENQAIFQTPPQPDLLVEEQHNQMHRSDDRPNNQVEVEIPKRCEKGMFHAHSISTMITGWAYT